jgi:hypothetical protein
MLRKLSLICVCVCFTGCSQNGPQVQFVEGTVTQNSTPVADADVCFTPKTTGDGIPAVGKTNANGVYRLTSAQGGEFGRGAVVGDYDVRVMKYIDLDFVMPPNLKIGDSAPLAKPKHHLPEKYANAKTSGLSATVKKGKNRIDFNLESGAAPSQ